MKNLIVYSYNNGTRWAVRWNGRGILTSQIESALRTNPTFATKEEAEAWIQEILS